MGLKMYYFDVYIQDAKNPALGRRKIGTSKIELDAEVQGPIDALMVPAGLVEGGRKPGFFTVICGFTCVVPWRVIATYTGRRAVSKAETNELIAEDMKSTFPRNIRYALTHWVTEESLSLWKSRELRIVLDNHDEVVEASPITVEESYFLEKMKMAGEEKCNEY